MNDYDEFKIWYTQKAPDESEVTMVDMAAMAWQAARAASPKVPQDDHIMDALVYGTGFMQDGKRVDPKDVYKQALPQGVEEWIEQHAFETESNGWSSNKCVVPVASLRAYLSGMAIVPVEQKPYECFSTEGDSWFDCPDDIEFVQDLSVVDEFTSLAGWRAETVTYRVTKAPDEHSDDYEVAMLSAKEKGE